MSKKGLFIKTLACREEKYWDSKLKKVVKKFTYYFIHRPSGAIIKYHDSACLSVDKRKTIPNPKEKE